MTLLFALALFIGFLRGALDWFAEDYPWLSS